MGPTSDSQFVEIVTPNWNWLHEAAALTNPMTSFTKKVLVFACGGTIDRKYVPEIGKLEFGHESVVPRLLLESRCENYYFEQIMNKDSANMNNGDRQTIFERVMRTTEPGDCIVITHGTDTMIETARFIFDRLNKTPGGIDRVVVLTGAMTPGRYEGSDAPANLAGALAVARVLTPGVRIHMNGYTLSPLSVETDDLVFKPGPGGDTALHR